MRLVIAGLTISSSWGNGHATTYRGLVRALSRRGHDVIFLERDVPWYERERDAPEPEGCRLELYSSVEALRREHLETLRRADAVVVGSYVPDGVEVLELVLEEALGVVAFYDIDTPVTLATLNRGECTYLSSSLIPELDLYLSFSGGPVLEHLERELGARRASQLACSADPERHRPLEVEKRWRLGYLGTYSPDRQPALDSLLVAPARSLSPRWRYVVAGPSYPSELDWPANVDRIEHLAPGEHAAFYSAQELTLNVTRADMVRSGWSPSVRLFEAAACGVPVLSDAWPGLEAYFEPGTEIAVATSAEDACELLSEASPEILRRMGDAARQRFLREHTSNHRAETLELELLQAARQRGRRAGVRPAKKMWAAKLIAPGKIEMVESPIPEPGPGEVRVRLEGSGVCASNLGPWMGLPFLDLPLEAGALGHEGWGIVDRVGAGVTTLAEGDRVTGLSYRAYAEYDVSPEGHWVRLPAALDGRPVPGEPLGCAMNVFERSDLSPGQTVAIVGVGFLGALLTRLASAMGARVLAISRRPFSLELAAQMGAETCLTLDHHERVLAEVRELTGGAWCERVIEATGKPWPLDVAADITGERGRLIIAGYHQDGPRQVDMQMWNWRGFDVINAHERDHRVAVEGIRAALDRVASGEIDLDALLTHVFPLGALGRALDATRDRPDGFVKGVVVS